jgi:hypothetical protein
MRLAAAEELLEAGRWSIFDRQELCDRFGVTMETVCKWADKVEAVQLARMRAELKDRELATMRLLMNLRYLKRLFADTIQRTDGKNATPGPLLKLLELEAKLLGLGDQTADRIHVEHSGSVAVLVESASPAMQARAVIQSLPAALRVLGIPVDPDLDRLPAMLEDMVDGRDLIEAVEIEVDLG